MVASGKAASTMRSSSSRSPSNGRMRWLPGTWMVSCVVVKAGFLRGWDQRTAADPATVGIALAATVAIASP